MRPAGVLLWQEIERKLASEIEDGIHAIGARLPVMEDMAQRFGVNVHTMRRALSALRERGLVSIEQGRGTFVRGPTIQYPIGRRTRFTETVSPQSRTIGSVFLSSCEIPAPERIAQDLQVPEGSSCILIEDTRLVNSVSVSFNRRYFPLPRFSGIDQLFNESGSITKALRSRGVDDYLRQRTRIHARGASTDEAEHLRIVAGSPVLVVQAVNVDLDGVPIESNSSISPGGQFELMIDT
jgi:GntR family phosphonate transport system transcriptional regulator